MSNSAHDETEFTISNFLLSRGKNKIFSTAMNLREIIEKIKFAKGWKYDYEVAQAIGMRTPTFSKAMLSPEWQRHFDVFLEVIKLCQEENIDIGGPKPGAFDKSRTSKKKGVSGSG